MLGLKLNHVSKRGHCSSVTCHVEKQLDMADIYQIHIQLPYSWMALFISGLVQDCSNSIANALVTAVLQEAIGLQYQLGILPNSQPPKPSYSQLSLTMDSIAYNNHKLYSWTVSPYESSHIVIYVLSLDGFVCH